MPGAEYRLAWRDKVALFSAEGIEVGATALRDEAGLGAAPVGKSLFC